MAALTFETREALLTLDQNGDEEAAPVISLKLSLSSRPTVYVSGGAVLQSARWTMIIRADDQARQVGTLNYAANDGKPECQVLINQSSRRFHDVLEMFKGGHASEITIEADGMKHQGDYSSHWDTDASPVLTVLRVSFEFPLPQSEA